MMTSTTMSMSDVVACVLFMVLLDLPSHLVDARRQIFLPRGMLGRIDCQVDANPPVTLTVWTKDERVIDVTRTTRFKIQADGTLLIKPVAPSDEGRYACTPYSSLGAGQTSPSIDIVVRGSSTLFHISHFAVVLFDGLGCNSRPKINCISHYCGRFPTSLTPSSSVLCQHF